MINCTYLNYNERIVFGTIVSHMYNPGKGTMQRVTTRIYRSYDQYLTSFPSLLGKRQSEFNPLEITEKNTLISCYKNSASTFTSIRGDIFDIQPNVLKQYCPYCLLDRPVTLDHYISKEEFPEYSVLIKNLVPCCWKCNNTKDELWRKNGSRRFIHFYLDFFLNQRFLFAKIVLPRGSVTPRIEYYLNKGTLNNHDFRIVKFHFKELSLLNEYSSRANTLISTEVDTIQDSKRQGAQLHDIINNLTSRQNSLRRTFGVNHWKAAIYEALANHTIFLNSL